MRSPVHDITAREGEVLSLTRGDWHLISDVIKISRYPDSAGSCVCVMRSPVHETTVREGEVLSQTRGVQHLISKVIAMPCCLG